MSNSDRHSSLIKDFPDEYRNIFLSQWFHGKCFDSKRFYLFFCDAGTIPVQRMIGRLMQANRGTIFLDEIAEVPLSMQAEIEREAIIQTLEKTEGNKSEASKLLISPGRLSVIK